MPGSNINYQFFCPGRAQLKKIYAILILILVFQPVMLLYSIPCVTEGCFGSGSVFKACGDYWEDNYAGVHYHCHCVCGPCDSVKNPCVAVVSGGAGGGSASAQVNLNSDVNGSAYFSRNDLFAIEDWANDNDTKWKSFMDRSLERGYGNLSSFINGDGSGMPFNDFVYQTTMKYLNNNYFNGGSGDPRLLRDDSTIPNASFYAGYGKKTGGKGADDGPPPPAPKIPDGISWVDSGGVYIGNGKTPKLLRGGDEDVTFEERERARLNTVIDERKLVKMDNEAFDYAAGQAEQAGTESDKNNGMMRKVLNFFFEKAQDKVESDSIDEIKELITGGDEAKKERLGTALDVIDGTKELKKLYDMRGDQQALTEETSKNMEKLMAGQLKGMQKEVSDKGRDLYKKFMENKLNSVINEVKNGSNAIIKTFTGKPLNADEQDIINRATGRNE